MKKKAPLLIAEIGNNHEGKFDLAKKLILSAKKGGADAVKFQTYSTEKFVTKKSPSFRRLKKFELSIDEHIKLAKFTKKNNLKYITTPLSISLIDKIKNYVDYFKVASSDNNFHFLMKKLFKTKKKIIISMGLINEKEIIKLKDFIFKNYNLKKTFFLHCVTNYPADPKELNLNFIKNNKYKIQLGYSDHCPGVIASIIAVNMGAIMIEKHFTLDKNFSDFRDHNLSADQYDLNIISDYIKKQSDYIGQKKKRIQTSEKKITNIVRRSIYVTKNISKNQKISLDCLEFLRPFNALGLPINSIEIALKAKAKNNIKKGSLLKPNDLKD